MIFNSLGFLAFFPIVCLIFYMIPLRVRPYWLLVSSYFFYMCWNAKYVVLLLLSTLTTYACGLLLSREKEGKKRTSFQKAVVASGIVINLGLLFFFKYFNFTLETLAKAISLFSPGTTFNTLDILLPVGISFYTFQALGYVIDVYRGTISAEKNVFKYALFVSFFPQLVAGPIERSGNLMSQLQTGKPFNYEEARKGFLTMLWGYFLKIVIADRAAVFVDAVYGNTIAYGGFFIVIATMLFAVQIYCDFYGYSSIAVGAARIMGIRLTENFRSPYLATSVADFWRGWHISLTSWFKDYLYIPLGGNRKGKLRKYFNKIFVFLVSGLWHGASFSFVVWGGLNGLYQVIGEVTIGLRNRIAKVLGLHSETFCYRLFRGIMTFAFVDFAWIFFRAQSLPAAMDAIKAMVGIRNWWILFDGSLYGLGLSQKEFWLMILCILVLVIADICKKKSISLSDAVIRQDTLFRVVLVSLFIVVLLLFGKYGPEFEAKNFIYFQF